MRMFKFIAVFRVFRLVRFFRPLRLMWAMVLNSIRIAPWACFMFFLILYTFAIMFLQGVVGFLATSDEPDDDLMEFWVSVDTAVLSLYMAISGGYDWDVIAAPLARCDAAYYAIFCVYIVVLMLSVLNILIGAFCNAALQIVDKEQQEVFKMVTDLGVKTLCEHGIEDQFVTWSGAWSLVRHAKTLPLVRFFDAMQLQKSEARVVFNAVCGSSERALTSAFIRGCVEFRGGVTRRAVLFSSLTALRSITVTKRLVGFIAGSLARFEAAFDDASVSGVTRHCVASTVDVLTLPTK